MKRLCCFALSLLPLSAFPYPIEVDPQLNGTEVSYSTQDIGRDMGAILLTNLG
ncbi:3-phosphoglycerate kinase, partial [Vibrio vulnificus]